MTEPAPTGPTGFTFPDYAEWARLNEKLRAARHTRDMLDLPLSVRVSDEPRISRLATPEEVATWQANADAEVKSLVEQLAAIEAARAAEGRDEAWRAVPPHDLVIHCPSCGKQHLDIGEFETRVHRKHLCDNTPEGEKTGCGHVWAPFPYATRGVLRLPLTDDERLKELDTLRMSLTAADPPSCTVVWWHDGHDGPGWYYYDSEYTDEGSVGAFAELSECVLHASSAGYIVESIDGPGPAKT